MTFVSPLWLLLLIPWAGLVIYLMLGKPPREPVPFLWLWRGPAARRRAKPSISKLPVWIALLLLSAAAAIVAAAGPGIQHQPPTDKPAGRVGVTHVAVRNRQAMVTLLNQSPRREADLTVEWPVGEGHEGFTSRLVLPESGSRTWFFDLPADIAAVEVRLHDGETVQMQRRRTWPRIDARTPLPASLRRMLDTYAERRPAGDDSATIAIAAGATLDEQPGAILAETGTARSGKVTVTDHAVTREINWQGLLLEPTTAEAPPAGFTPLVRVGDHAVLGARENPRQVWVGFDTPGFSRSVEYVVFWSNVFDFTGQGGDVWEPMPGTVLASPTPGNPVQKRVQSLAAWVAMAAVALSAAGVLLVPRRPA